MNEQLNNYNCISIVIPIFNEEKNILKLLKEINSLIDIKYKYEIIIINDCSIDNSKDLLTNIKSDYNFVLINNKKNMGQSFCISIGIKNAKYDNIVTIDGDGQNHPKDINKILNIYFESDYSLVGGIRKKRKDKMIKRFSSVFANKIRKFILKYNCPVTGCSLKVFKKYF